MKKRKLGDIPQSETYLPAGEDCMFADSVEAFEFLEEFYGKDGMIVLGSVRLCNIACSSILVWLYFDVKAQEMLSLLPIFASDFEKAQASDIISFEALENEMFFFRGCELYASAYTSTGETVLRKMRSVLSLSDFWEILKLEGKYTATDLYPVKVYSEIDNSFLATCWAFSTDKNELYFKPVCIDDTDKFDGINSQQTTFFPIDLGETAEIGGQCYVLRYSKENGRYFEKVFKAYRVDGKKKGMAKSVKMPNVK